MPSIIEAGFTQKSLADFKRTMLYMRLPEKERKRVMQKVLWRLKDIAKKSVNNAQAPDGTKWALRKKVKSKKKSENKLLRKAATLLNSKLIDNLNGELNYQKSKTAQIFHEHFYGEEVKVKQSKEEKKAHKKIMSHNHEAATEEQGKRLKQLGYQKTKKLKNGKVKTTTPSAKAIAKMMTRGQAGLLIRLREQQLGIDVRRGLKSYKLPKRQFLETREKEVSDIITEEVFKAFDRMGIHLGL